MSILFELPWLGVMIFLTAIVAVGVLPFYVLSLRYSDRVVAHTHTVAGSDCCPITG